jgi:hypothetical protein
MLWQPLGCLAHSRKTCGQVGHGRGAYIVLKGVITSRGIEGFYFKLNGNQTKQIGKYIFMENILHQQGQIRFNLHPEGLRHC